MIAKRGNSVSAITTVFGGGGIIGVITPSYIKHFGITHHIRLPATIVPWLLMPLDVEKILGDVPTVETIRLLRVIPVVKNVAMRDIVQKRLAG